ncbi:MAG: hypothetical protein QM831_01490 [Kofleriaceae bacterium]
MLRGCVLALVLTGGCDFLDDDCKPDTTRCAGDELQICVAHGGGFYGTPPEYVHSSSPTWTASETCGANLCVGETGGDAFCAIEPRPDPICAGGSSDLCDGETHVVCLHGYVVEREACTGCAGILGCDGGLFASCTGDGDCAGGMTCVNHACELACECPDGACAACTAIADWAPGQEGALTPPVCKAGRCTFD